MLTSYTSTKIKRYGPGTGTYYEWDNGRGGRECHKLTCPKPEGDARQFRHT